MNEPDLHVSTWIIIENSVGGENKYQKIMLFI